MVTTIKFIGLLVVTLTSPGAHVIMGHFPDTGHDSFIAYSHNQYVSNTGWPAAGSFSLGGVTYDYVMVGKENVTFAGPSDAFVSGIGSMPHLQCCCPTMAGFKPEYGDPNAPLTTKLAAHFTIDHGLLQTYVEPTTAVSTLLTFNTGENLTIHGEEGATTRDIVLKPGATVIVGNTSLATLTAKTPPAAHDDFLLYYRMGVDSAACTSQPTSGPPCAPQASMCDVPVTATAKASAMAAQTVRRRAALTPRNRLRTVEVLSVNSNCSSSQWP